MSSIVIECVHTINEMEGQNVANWQKVLLHVANDVEKVWDLRVNQLKDRLNLMDRVKIVPYRGYGTRERVTLTGRVVEDRHITSAENSDSVWENMLNIYRRFTSNEIDQAQVRLRFGAVTKTATTDNNGFFTFDFAPDPDALDDTRNWYSVELELIEYPGPQQTNTRTEADILIPTGASQFGVISDVDDTVIKTDAVNLLKMARNTFVGNARTRLPFNGVAAFYTALKHGTEPGIDNPIFYLSSGYWNLYDLLIDFFRVRGIPKGPLFLTDLGLTENYWLTPGHYAHKLGHIERLLATYPQINFILSGDSGQKDPEIYVEAAENFPGRILAIYIRDVSKRERSTAIQTLAERSAAVGTPLMLVEDTVAAAEHAAAQGYILPAVVDVIRAERDSDQAPPNPIEALLDEDTLT